MLPWCLIPPAISVSARKIGEACHHGVSCGLPLLFLPFVSLSSRLSTSGDQSHIPAPCLPSSSGDQSHNLASCLLSSSGDQSLLPMQKQREETKVLIAYASSWLMLCCLADLVNGYSRLLVWLMVLRTTLFGGFRVSGSTR